MSPFARVRRPLTRVKSYLRLMWRGPKASRLYGRACRLAAAGKTLDAFELTKQALELIPDPDPDEVFPSFALIVVWTAFYAELAATLGRPTDANEAIRRAIRLGAAFAAFSDDPRVRRYIAWLRQQLADNSHA